MRAVMQRLWFRALILVILCLSLAVGIVAMTLFTFALEDGWYTQDYAQGEFGFEASTLCQSYIRECVDNVVANLIWLKDPTSDTLGGYGGAAFSYTIEGFHPKTGKYGVLADTTTDRSQLVTGSIEVPVLLEGALYEAAYLVTGYVNLPVQPYDGCYKEYYLFEQLYPLRHYYLPVGIVSILLTFLSLVFSIAAAVQIGRQGSVTVLGHIPFDAAVVGLYALVKLAERLIYRLPYKIIEIIDLLSDIKLSYSFFRRYCVLLAVIIGGLMLANQLAEKTWKQKLLLRRFAGRVSPVVMMGILLGGHLLAAAAAVITDDYYTRLYVLLGLGVFDLVLIPCVIRYAMEGQRIRQASNALAAGDLTFKVDNKKLHMIWRELGENLNSIGDGMALAVEEQMRSERMKTELITNVSHDLKTPLTSIINYIDFLRDTDLPEETRREYIEILERQGAKLKKLTEDVVEASKAASGAVEVKAEVFDVAELLEQSVGEYSERLQDAGIEPIIHTPEEDTYLLADGRLMGRVLDNFITNILKYAQPGTRAYFDLTAGEENTVIAVKNTSREPLDIPAEELMERFVRGDSSRGSEGSGLGLSIGRSLTELMGGRMDIILDGDLFKIELTFPSVKDPVPEAIEEGV